jgi:DNA polymerase III subunit beta
VAGDPRVATNTDRAKEHDVKFTVERDPFADAVAWAAKSVPHRPATPVLAGLMLRAADGTLQVSGFDHDVSSQAGVTVRATATGAALVPGRLLADITKALPAKPVAITCAGSHLDLVCGSARFTLPTMPIADYPTLPEMPQGAGTVDAAAFATAVAQVAVATARDEVPMFAAIRIELTGPTLTLLATDRYRLALRELPWNPQVPTADRHALVPARTLADTAKALGPLGGDITLALAHGGAGEGTLGLAGQTRCATSRLLDATNYPPVRSLFPTSHKSEATVCVPALTEVVRRVSLVAERGTPIRLSFSDNGLVVEAGDIDEARASEVIEESGFTGDPLTIMFNPQYLLDGLSALNAPAATLRFVDPVTPAVLTPAGEDGRIIPEYQYLIMPIRVSH